ncbi:hypothetical protein Taro_001201 [Colocasia esculenta]|uniref:Uncharacterized protein n=1 Tax=Colocasia esculenta TaxID=4460 RepID=A0A843TIH1_COLES|nr:hypothetical protein [Colocasia esculenta]
MTGRWRIAMDLEPGSTQQEGRGRAKSVERTLKPSSGKSYHNSCRYTLAPWSSSWWLTSEEREPHSRPLRVPTDTSGRIQAAAVDSHKVAVDRWLSFVDRHVLSVDIHWFF